MNQLIAQIMTERFQDARATIVERLNTIRDIRCVQMKMMIGDTLGESHETTELLTEGDVLRRGRINLIRRRIRRGKLQRNIRRSAIKGFTLKRGKLTRIPAAARIRMRLKARRAAIKRRSKLQQSLRKRRISLRKRKAMGIH